MAFPGLIDIVEVPEGDTITYTASVQVFSSSEGFEIGTIHFFSFEQSPAEPGVDFVPILLDVPFDTRRDGGTLQVPIQFRTIQDNIIDSENPFFDIERVGLAAYWEADIYNSEGTFS